MINLILINRYTKKLIARNLKIADNFGSRLKGLMFTRHFPGGGLIIKPCQGVHTYFMKYPIDVLILNKENIVIHKEISLAPNKRSPFFLDAKTVIELPSGTLLNTQITLGDKLFYSENRAKKTSIDEKVLADFG